MPHGHCSPQGPGQGAAACPNFPKERVQDHLATTLLPLRPPLGLPAGYMAAWLFGAVLPPWAQPYLHHPPAYLGSAASSLSQNGNQENPSCCGIDGILEAYHSSLRTVQLYGPTNFAPVVTHVAR